MPTLQRLTPVLHTWDLASTFDFSTLDFGTLDFGMRELAIHDNNGQLLPLGTSACGTVHAPASACPAPAG